MPRQDSLASTPKSPVEQLSSRAYPILDAAAQGSDPIAQLADLWRILVKHRSTVLATIVLTTTLAVIFAFKMTPIYRAGGQIEIESATPQVQSLNEVYRAPTVADEEFLETQVKILSSDNLAWQTTQQLGLANNPAFCSQEWKLKGEAPDSAALRGRLLRLFANQLDVSLSRNTHMVSISFEAKDPELAARVVNALVTNYVEFNFRSRYEATRQASSWMEQQLDELKAKVEKSQAALVQYERENSIVNVSEKQNLVEQRLSDLGRDLTAAESDRAQKESLYQLVNANPEQTALLAQNELLQRLQEKYADAKTQYVDAESQYGPNFPKVLRIGEQVKALQALIDQERHRTIERIKKDYMSAVGRERLVTESLSRGKAEFGRLNELLIQHNILKHDFESNQQLYDNLLQRLKDAAVSAGLRANNVHVIDAAFPPLEPVRPRKLLYSLAGLLVSLFTGAGLALLREGLDTSIKGLEDIERLVPVPSLGVIPAASAVGRHGYGYGYGLKQGKDRDENHSEPVEMIVLRKPASTLAEAFRALRSSILLSAPSHPPKSMLLTSAQPGEGKTCTALNLAVTLAQRGSKVVIIDGDLRRPGISRVLGLPETRGLSGILTGAHGLDEALMQIDGLPRLWVLPAGSRPPNPADLLSSSTMGQLMDELRRRFDHIVLDSPPSLAVTDATVLSPLVDGVILVVESGATARDALKRTYQILSNAGAKILGVVLNKIDLRRDGYYGRYYRGYYYSHYYGYSEADATPAPQVEAANTADTQLPPGEERRS